MQRLGIVLSVVLAYLGDVLVCVFICCGFWDDSFVLGFIEWLIVVVVVLKSSVFIRMIIFFIDMIFVVFLSCSLVEGFVSWRLIAGIVFCAFVGDLWLLAAVFVVVDDRVLHSVFVFIVFGLRLRLFVEIVLVFGSDVFLDIVVVQIYNLVRAFLLFVL